MPLMFKCCRNIHLKWNKEMLQQPRKEGSLKSVVVFTFNLGSALFNRRHVFFLLLLPLSWFVLLHPVVTHPSCTSAATQLSPQHFSLPQKLWGLKNTAGWLPLNQEEHGLCGQRMIPTMWISLYTEQLWTPPSQHNPYAEIISLLLAAKGK